MFLWEDQMNQRGDLGIASFLTFLIFLTFLHLWEDQMNQRGDYIFVGRSDESAR
jgi:hypothetical protein